MVQPKEEKDLPDSMGDRQLSTEEEVRMLKEELAKKEKELESLKPGAEKISGDLIQEESKEEEIKSEQEKIRVSSEEPGKVKLPKKVTQPKKIQDEDIASDLKEIMSMEKPKQVKTLVYLAFKKGVNYAANIASQLKDPYLLDEFHDTMVDNLYDLLKKKLFPWQSRCTLIYMP